MAYIVNITDQHAGAWGGLTNPNAILKVPGSSGEEFTPPLTDFQKWLWHEVYLWGIERVKEITGGKEKIYLLNTGDIIHGNHFLQSTSLIHGGQQVDLAVANLAPWWERMTVSELWTTYGTMAHSVDEGLAEDMIVAKIIASGHKASVVQHSLITVENTEIDTGHHGPVGGKRKWLEGNDARLYLRDVMSKCLDDLDCDPPAVVLRGHRHTYIHEISVLTRGIVEYLSHLFICPPLCGMDAFAHKATQSNIVMRFGMVLLEVENGRLMDSWPLMKVRDARKVYCVASERGVNFGQRFTKDQTLRENDEELQI